MDDKTADRVMSASLDYFSRNTFFALLVLVAGWALAGCWASLSLAASSPRPARHSAAACARLWASWPLSLSPTNSCSPRESAVPRYFAYLRVSRDSQDVANQRLGLLDFANSRGYAPLVVVEETASRSVPWRERALGSLLTEQAQRGDLLLTSEFTRLGGSPGQVFSILETAAERGVTIIITKNGTVMDGSLNAQIQAAAFAMASMIEVEFTRARTREGLQRARLEGRIGGRRKGSTGRLKLDPQRDKVGELHALGLTTPKLAKYFGVTEKTMRKFLARHFPKKAPD